MCLLRVIGALCRCRIFVTKHAWLPLIAITIANCLDVVVYGMLPPLLPAYEDIFQVSSIALGLLVACYAFVAIPVQPIVGWLSDHYRSRKFGLCLGLFLLSISTFLYGVSSSFPMLLLSRGLQGMSSAFTWTCGVAALSDFYPSSKDESLEEENKILEKERNRKKNSSRHPSSYQEDVAHTTNELIQPGSRLTSGVLEKQKWKRVKNGIPYTSLTQVVEAPISLTMSEATEISKHEEEEEEEEKNKSQGAIHKSPQLGLALGLANAGFSVGGLIGAPLAGILYQVSDSFFVPFFVVSLMVGLAFIFILFYFPSSSTFEKPSGPYEISVIEILTDPEAAEAKAQQKFEERMRARQRTDWRSTNEFAVLRRMVERRLTELEADRVQAHALRNHSGHHDGSRRIPLWKVFYRNWGLIIITLFCQALAAYQMEYQGVALALYMNARFESSAALMGVCFGLLALSTAVSAVVGGMLADKFRVRWLIVTIGFVFYGFSSLLLPWPNREWMFAITVSLLGMALGICTVSVTLLEEVATYCGSEASIGWVYGIGFSAYTVGMFFGPLVAGWLAGIFDLATEFLFVQLGVVLPTLLFLGIFVIGYPTLLKRARRLSVAYREQDLFSPYDEPSPLHLNSNPQEELFILEDEEEEKSDDDLLSNEMHSVSLPHVASSSIQPNQLWSENPLVSI